MNNKNEATATVPNHAEEINNESIQLQRDILSEIRKLRSDSKQVLNIKEASAYLGIAMGTMYKLTSHKAIPGRKVGKKWHFYKPALNDWVAQKPEEKSVKVNLSRTAA